MGFFQLHLFKWNSRIFSEESAVLALKSRGHKLSGTSSDFQGISKWPFSSTMLTVWTCSQNKRRSKELHCNSQRAKRDSILKLTFVLNVTYVRFMHFCLMAICCPLDYRSVVACEQERKPYLCHKTLSQYPLCCVRVTLAIPLNMKHQVIWVFTSHSEEDWTWVIGLELQQLKFVL